MRFIGFTAAALCAAVAARSTAEDLSQWADPFVGTAYNGHTVPGAACPFGMVQASPDTGTEGWGYCSGFRWDDDSALGFSQMHLNGTGCADLGDFLLQPFVEGRVGADFRGHYVRDNLVATPGYFSALYTNGNVFVEATATPRTALYRFTWRDGGKACVLLDAQHGIGGDAAHRVLESAISDDGAKCVWGEQRRRGWVTRKTAFALAFDRPFVAKRVLPRRNAAEKGDRIVFTFDLGPGETLNARIALSRTGADAAKANLAAAADGFDAARQAARRAWNDVFSRALVTGTDDQKRNFYTALYHLCLQPNDISDAAEGRPFYSTFSCWDTFRAAGPLYTVLMPERAAAFVDSLLAQGKITGYLPIWTLCGAENQCMIGTHSIPMIVDWFLKSEEALSRPLRNAEKSSSAAGGQESASPLYWESAYRQIKDTLTKAHPGRTKENWDLYDKYGYYPFDKIRGESVSRTYECAYDDWCAGVMAEKLGHKEDAAFFFKRASNWKNVFDPSVGFARGRDSQGNWRTPFSPFALGHDNRRANDFTEGNAWHYTWHVMQDPEGLIAALGGRVKFAEKLASLFVQPEKTDDSGFVADATGLIGQYAHGNEPSHHTIYFFPYVGRGDLTAKYVREVFDRFYLPRPDGLCGNDDCGQMSAWYLFSAMGFYPFNPCGGDYVLGAPQVPEVVLEVGRRTPVRFVMTARNLSKENKYVKSVTLNGKPLEGFILKHADILAGGTLVFEMGP